VKRTTFENVVTVVYPGKPRAERITRPWTEALTHLKWFMRFQKAEQKVAKFILGK